MEKNGIRIRWIYAACFELVLANGVHIVTDPYITPRVPEEQFSLDQIEGADYILITHTHYDHISDLKELALKFHSRMIAGGNGIRELVRVFDLPFDLMYPVNPGEVLEFDDFTLEVSRARHSLLGKPELPASDLNGAGKRIYGVDGLDEVMAYGYLESLDFTVTALDNTRVMMASGNTILRNGLNTARKNAPNILLRQTSKALKPEEYGRLVASYRAAVNFPFHHENLQKKSGWNLAEYMEKADRTLREAAPGAQLVNPEPYRWYEISMETRLN
mgnify:CR=1 FL=1